MTLQEKVTEDLKAAMLANNMAKKSILRVLIGEFNREGKVVDDNKVISIIKKMVENATEQKNTVELEILAEYLPSQMNESELAAAIDKIKANKGYTTIKDMGKIMADLKAAHGGSYDGKLASELIKKSF